MENTLTKQNLTLNSPKGISFSSNLISKANEFSLLSKEERASRKEEISSLLKELRTEFVSLKKELKSKVDASKKEIEAKHKVTLSELDATSKSHLDEIQAKYNSIQNKTKFDDVEYKNSIKGAKVVAKRARIKENNAFDLAIKDENTLIEFLYNDYIELHKMIKGSKVAPILETEKLFGVFASTFSFKKMICNKSTWINLIPFLMLVCLIVAFFIAKSITGYGGDLTNVINNGVFIAVVATGAVFIYSSGSFDMSLGPASLMCASVAGILWNSTHNAFVSFIVAILLGALLGIVNAVLANILNLPVMVMTLTMMNILNAIHAVILQSVGNQLFIDGGLSSSNTNTTTLIYACFLVCFFLLLWAIFNYTKIGRKNKFIGSNATAAKFNGISLMKAGLISFAISGVGLGLCGFLFAMSKSGSSYSTGTILDTIGLNVVIAIVFGGMTTSGGPRSRVSCAVIGAFFCIFLDELFRAIGIADYRYLAKGIIFLVVSFINMYNSRPKMLAR